MTNTPLPAQPPPSLGVPEHAQAGLRVGFFRWNPLQGDEPPPKPRSRALFLGQYELLGLLGAGGAARVYLARRVTQPGHVVALKVFAEEFTIDPVQRRVLQATARDSARLAVPQLVRTYEVGESEGRLFVAMERIPGWSLSELRAACPYGLPERVAAAIGRQIVRGLHPGNVMLALDGSVRVLDLGSARSFSARRFCGGSRVRRGDPELLRGWLGSMERQLPALTVPGDWRGERP